ncbi:MAG: hypothetical protein QM755_04250 [Luteolibacter sp.]
MPRPKLNFHTPDPIEEGYQSAKAEMERLAAVVAAYEVILAHRGTNQPEPHVPVSTPTLKSEPTVEHLHPKYLGTGPLVISKSDTNFKSKVVRAALDKLPDHFTLSDVENAIKGMGFELPRQEISFVLSRLKSLRKIFATKAHGNRSIFHKNPPPESQIPPEALEE